MVRGGKVFQGRHCQLNCQSTKVCRGDEKWVPFGTTAPCHPERLPPVILSVSDSEASRPKGGRDLTGAISKRGEVGRPFCFDYFLAFSSARGVSRISSAGAKPWAVQPPPFDGVGALFISPATMKAGSTRRPFSIPSRSNVPPSFIARARRQLGVMRSLGLSTRFVDHRFRMAGIRGELTSEEMRKIDDALRIVFSL